MGKSWVPLCMIMVVLGLAACQQSAAPTVVLTPAAEIIVQAPVATGARALEVLTPTPADAQQTAISATRLPPIDLTQMTGDSWFSISPDGNWTAQVQVAYPFDKNGVTTGDQYYVRLEVMKYDGSLNWTALDKWSDWGLGYTIPANLHWRQDSRRLYFSEQAVAEGCLIFGNENGLYEVNLEDGYVREISGQTYGELQASPDGQRIAILSDKVIALRDFSGAQIAQSKLDFIEGDWQAGKLIWSPDGKMLAFTVMFNPCGPPDSSSVYRMNVDTGNLVALVEQDERVFVASKWLPDGKVELVDAAGGIWHIDAATRTLKKEE